MLKNIVKLAPGVATILMLWYTASLPVAAIDVCPEGITVPGCAGVDIGLAVGSIVSILLFVAFLIALVFLIIGGIRWILSGGDKEASSKAKDTVTAALIGLVVVIAAFVLINVVLKLLLGKSLNEIFTAPPVFKVTK